MMELIGELLPFTILLLAPIIMLWPTVRMSVDSVRVGRVVFKGLTLSLSVFDGTRYRCRTVEVVLGYKGGIVLIVRRSVGSFTRRPCCFRVWVYFPSSGKSKAMPSTLKTVDSHKFDHIAIERTED